MTHFLLQAAANTAAPGGGTSALKFITGGGAIGYIIVLLSIVAFAFVVVHFVQIRASVQMPRDRINAVKELLRRGQLEQALEDSLLPANDCYFLRTLAPGLKRFIASPFGAFEMKSALEESGIEQTARLYRTMDVIGVIGSVGPLLGLLGTVQGMIGAFETVASSAAHDSTYYEALAANIAIALITTFQGLVVAIPCVSLYSFFRNRVDRLAGDAASEMEEVVAIIESTGKTKVARV